MTQQDIEQYRLFTEKLKIEEHRSAALNDIKNLFVYKPANEAAPTIRNIGIGKILHCLNGSDKEQIKLTCEVLKLCFEKFEIGDVVKIYLSHIMYLLRHENDCVRRLALDEIYKVVTSDPALLPVPQYIDVYVAVGQMVADKDVGVANKALLVTSNLPAKAYPKVLEEMKIALEGNSSSKCNTYEVVINISLKSYEIFELCVKQGYLDFMVNELQTDDILYQLNILELISQLATKPHGINFLVKQGTLQKISELVKDLQNNPFGGLLTPGYLKFFGCIAHSYPNEVFQKYPALLDLLFDGLESDDLTILPVALDTLGFIGTTWEGKLCLVAIGFVEYLLDRSADFKKQSKEAKYAIIKRLSQSTAFDDNIIMRLQTYVKQGPFYSETMMQVAMEEE